MALLLALLSCSSVSASVPHLDNFDFGQGQLTHWEGEGFYPTTATGRGPGPFFGVCSSDCGKPGQMGLLYRTFVVPPDAGSIHFKAYASLGPGEPLDTNLNVHLEAAQRKLIPKRVRTVKDFERVETLLPPANGHPREYVWSVAGRAGETLRILIVDHNPRPGRHVFCSGFRFQPVDQFERQEFERDMSALVGRHKLPMMVSRPSSKHFMALSNTGEKFTQGQLDNCELLYMLFVNHFRSRGFRLREPGHRLMVAVFSTQEGLEAYFGARTSPMITGLYDPSSNRLVVYDFGRNRRLMEQKQRTEQFAQELSSDLARLHVLGTLDRQAQAVRAEANLSTIMHEAAHLISFNCGLLHRDADKPLWLVEGLACYCEATERGRWKGIGELNPERLKTLAAARDGKTSFLPVRTLLAGDGWLHEGGSARQALTGYAQSWALFRMLMEQRPGDLCRYMELIYHRHTREHRLADFVQVFGSDLAGLERRHQQYVNAMLQVHRQP